MKGRRVQSKLKNAWFSPEKAVSRPLASYETLQVSETSLRVDPSYSGPDCWPKMILSDFCV